MALTKPAQVKAIGHPLRTTILQLLHERGATVTELAAAVNRPKSTVAHHVDVLTRNRLLRVVRTRKVRAIEKRFYGRTAHMFYVAAEPSRDGEGMPRDFNELRGGCARVRDGVRAGTAVGLHPACESPTIRPLSSGTGWPNWLMSSTGFRGPAKPRTGSRSASTHQPPAPADSGVTESRGRWGRTAGA